MKNHLTLAVAFFTLLGGCSLPEDSPIAQTQDTDAGAQSTNETEDETDTPVVDAGGGLEEPPVADAGNGTPEVPVVDAGEEAPPAPVPDAGGAATECPPGTTTDGGACVPVDYCAGIECNNGTCINNADGYTCACEAGYEGTHCETNTDDCASIECGQGTCVDLVDGFECDCASGYQDNDGNGTCELACGTTNCGQCNQCDDSSGAPTCVCSGVAGCEAAGVDGTCSPIYCGTDEYVDANMCSTCEGGTYNEPGDNAFAESSTSCDAECTQNAHCGDDGPYQVCRTYVCGGCSGHSQCAGDLPYCTVDDGSTQAPDDGNAIGGTNDENPGSGSGSGNVGNNAGSTNLGVCVECASSSHCNPSTGHPTCSGNECICTSNSDCNVVNGTCLGGSCR